MKIEVLEMRAVVDFINKVNPRELSDNDLLDFAEMLDRKKAEANMERFRRRVDRYGR
jgi:hypothetical protein